MATAKMPPWKRPRPAGKRKPLTASQKSAARRSAAKAGRRYPNLVDNMLVARKRSDAGAGRKATKKTATKKAAAKKSAAKKTAAKKTATKKAPTKKTTKKTTKRVSKASKRAKRTKAAATKDPHGGLTPAGREAFKRSEGAHLRPGVTKPQSAMTPDDMRRKGTWATRFYGRSKLPALVDRNGEPTRFALTAAAWGEPVPRSPAAARRIAAKGRRLLVRYRRLKASKSAFR